jgi:hypothetical protein
MTFHSIPQSPTTLRTLHSALAMKLCDLFRADFLVSLYLSFCPMIPPTAVLENRAVFKSQQEHHSVVSASIIAVHF